MPSRPASDGDDLIAGIIRSGNLLVRQLTPLLQPWKITPQQWSILRSIASSDSPPSMAEISRSMAVSKQNITGMIGRLETLGLLRRSGNPDDLRAARISITGKGSRLIAASEPAFRTWLKTTLGDFSERDRKAMIRSIQRLTELLES
ncbi:MAG: MarR family transcriptional regulator [Acidobacteriota bacterium]